MAREHDQVDVVLVREMNDLLGRPALPHRDVGGEAGGCELVVGPCELAVRLGARELPLHGIDVPARGAEHSEERDSCREYFAHRRGERQGTRRHRRAIQRHQDVANRETGIPGGGACGPGEGGPASRLRVPRAPLSDSGDLQERVG